MRALRNRRPGVRAFGGYDAEIAGWNLARIGGGMQPRSEIGGSGDAETILIDRSHVLGRNVISVNLDIRQFRQMRAKDAADCPASHDANSHAHAVFSASSPV